jgi:hypothetical protein
VWGARQGVGVGRVSGELDSGGERSATSEVDLILGQPVVLALPWRAVVWVGRFCVLQGAQAAEKAHRTQQGWQSESGR